MIGYREGDIVYCNSKHKCSGIYRVQRITTYMVAVSSIKKLYTNTCYSLNSFPLSLNDNTINLTTSEDKELRQKYAEYLI